MDNILLVNIASKAWALTILSLLHDGVPGRQAALLSASGATRTAFTQSLAHLLDIGLLERNPGHGHPLRPEYRLTEKGMAAAAAAARILALTPGAHRPLIRKTWTVPILSVLSAPRQFNDIKRALPMMTDRAQSQSLKSMEDHGWVQRRVDEVARPPRSLYRAIDTGAQIARAISSVEGI